MILATLDYLKIDSGEGHKRIWVKNFKFEQPSLLSVVELNGRVRDFDMRIYSVQITIVHLEGE